MIEEKYRSQCPANERDGLALISFIEATRNQYEFD